MEKYTYTKAAVLPATAVVMTYDIGFIPSYVRIDAYSSPTVTNGILTAGTYVGSLEWTDVMAALSAFKILANGTGALVTTNGISKSDTTSAYKGFSVGVETTCNVATYGWVITAQRN